MAPYVKTLLLTVIAITSIIVQCVEGGVNLFPDVSTLADSLYITQFDFSSQDTAHCLVNDGCIGSAEGVRTLLRFSTKISNIGDEDFRIGRAPATRVNRSPWHWNECTESWQVLGYASYELKPKSTHTMPVKWPCRWRNGRLVPEEKRGRAPVATGRKNGFCLMDLADIVSGSGSCPFGRDRANCGNQGISVGCADVYSSGLQCQWIDITGIDIDDTEYELSVTVNPDRTMQEDDYSDNTAVVDIKLSELDTRGMIVNDLLG